MKEREREREREREERGSVEIAQFLTNDLKVSEFDLCINRRESRLSTKPLLHKDMHLITSALQQPVSLQLFVLN